MSTANKTTLELTNNIIAQLESTLGQSIPFLPKSFMRVLARAIAAVYILLYKYIGFGIRQGFVKYASTESTTVNGRVFTPLFEWGELIGVGRPATATQAELQITVTVENQVGNLASGSQLIYQPTGVTYITLGTVALNAPTVVATVRAVGDQTGGNGAGVIGNVPPGESLSFANPLDNVARDTLVDSIITNGADGEDLEVYRQRVLGRMRSRPQGGALSDYRLWGEEPAGIVTVYPYTSASCPGQVDVYVEATPESSGNPDGIPTTPQLQEVLDAINYNEDGLANRRPVGALVNTLPITRTGFGVVVLDLTAEDVAGVQAQVTDALEQYIAERRPFIVGLDFPPRFDRITNAAVSGVVDDVVSAAGGTFNGVVITLGFATVTAYNLGPGEEAKFLSINFNP